MKNGGLDEAEAGINIVGRNINNLRYADDTTLVAENQAPPSLGFSRQEHWECVAISFSNA